jgi:hypothetical protein
LRQQRRLNRVEKCCRKESSDYPLGMQSAEGAVRAAAEQISVLTSARMNSSIAAETRERSHAAAVIMMIIHLRHCLRSHCIKSQCNFNMLRHQCTISPASISPPSALASLLLPCLRANICAALREYQQLSARARACLCSQLLAAFLFPHQQHSRLLFL